jgi:hypothetical protein
MKTNKSMAPTMGWVKKTLCGSAALGLAMTMCATSAIAGGDFKPFTPVSRIAAMNVVRVQGEIDYKASYAKARAASVALATYVARLKEADLLGSDVIAGIDWKLGGFHHLSPLIQMTLLIWQTVQ